jgi:hypothetical protein
VEELVDTSIDCCPCHRLSGFGRGDLPRLPTARSFLSCDPFPRLLTACGFFLCRSFRAPAHKLGSTGSVPCGSAESLKVLALVSRKVVYRDQIEKGIYLTGIAS